ncbi:MAG: nuclear transport factor 2 family protein [Gemmatimonadales bacterium]
MRHVLLTIWMVLAAAGPAVAQDGATMDADEDGVIRAAMDYMEGGVTADAERVARGVHPELTKVVVRTLPQTGRQVLSYNTQTTLVEFVRGMAERMAEVDKGVEVTVFDIGHDLAAARVVGQLWYDFLQLAKIKGEWKIVNVLWARNQPDAANRQPADVETAEAEVKSTALDYIEGAYSGDADRMERALHPELTKMMLGHHRQTGEPFLYKMGASDLIEGTRAGLGALEEDKRNIEVDVYDIAFDMASVKVASAMYIDYLQIAKVNGDWKIIDVLWVPNPEARQQGE